MKTHCSALAARLCLLALIVVIVLCALRLMELDVSTATALAAEQMRSFNYRDMSVAIISFAFGAILSLAVASNRTKAKG